MYSAGETPFALVAPIAARFELDGRLRTVDRFGSGHINDTFCAVYESTAGLRRYVFQRVNGHVFADVPALMENVARVTRHLRARLEQNGAGRLDRRALRLVRTAEGGDFVVDGAGAYWRAYPMIEGASTYQVPESRHQVRAAAKGFGLFAALLSDLPPPPLHESIPGFHDTPARLQALREAIAADPCNRAAQAVPEISLAERYADLAPALRLVCEQSAIPLRVAHNDTKINNVLIDDRTGEAICVLDLDTVMPGQVLCDFGDFVRTATCRAPEDEPDPGKVQIDEDLFEAAARGYVEGTDGLLLPAEIENLTTAAKVLTFECGVRFLADFLSGDRYFKVHRPQQNLDRARAQFALVASMERAEGELRRRVCAVMAAQ